MLGFALDQTIEAVSLTCCAEADLSWAAAAATCWARDAWLSLT